MLNSHLGKEKHSRLLTAKNKHILQQKRVNVFSYQRQYCSRIL